MLFPLFVCLIKRYNGDQLQRESEAYRKRTRERGRESVLANTLTGTHTLTKQQMQMQPLFVVGPSAVSLLFVVAAAAAG